MILKRLRLTLDMIKFEHSVFALPFALTGALLAFREEGYIRFWEKLLWIVLAMVCARSAAMAFNRLVDSDIDSRNPRTRMRHLPTGLLSRGFAWAFVAVTSTLFVLAAGELNPLCLHLAPLALAVVFFYSFTKRFTSFSHIVLGFSLGIAPAAAWIAAALLAMSSVSKVTLYDIAIPSKNRTPYSVFKSDALKSDPDDGRTKRDAFVTFTCAQRFTGR
jgi:4-hydroxybenzoate polyprenyltransferase